MAGVNDSAAKFPDTTTQRRCRVCGEWLDPEYGAMKVPRSFGVFSPRATLRAIAASATGDESDLQFECFGCEARRKGRLRILYVGLGLALVYALVADYLDGHIKVPW